MLNIIQWKLAFECAHLKRAFNPNIEDKVYYFAFGANLSPAVLEKRRVQIFDSFDYVLQEAQLRFTQVGFYRNHGYASADPAIDEVVFGKMYLMLKSDAHRMDHFEGVPYLKVHEKITRNFEKGEFFYYRSVNPQKGLKPTQEYLDYITNAYSSMNIVPEDYLESLGRTPVLTEFLMQNKTGKHVKNIDRWPRFLHPLLVCYEGLCLRLVEVFWNRSLVQWMIKH